MERSEKIDKDYHDKSLRDKTGDKIAEYQEKLKELSIEKNQILLCKFQYLLILLILKSFQFDFYRYAMSV